jgi:hypothetical protein
MALRQVLSKMLIPNLERDLSKSIGTELSAVGSMMDTMLAPHVYGYESRILSGGFQATGARKAPSVSSSSNVVMKKVEFPVPVQGLFQ